MPTHDLTFSTERYELKKFPFSALCTSNADSSSIFSLPLVVRHAINPNTSVGIAQDVITARVQLTDSLLPPLAKAS